MSAESARESDESLALGEGQQRPDTQRPTLSLPLGIAELFEEPAVGDVRGTHGLAGAAAEAERALVSGGGVEDVDRPIVDGAHERDPPARRRRLVTRQFVRGAGGQAEPAGDAFAEILGVEDAAGRYDPSFPGLRMPTGSNARLIRASSAICGWPSCASG